MTTMIQITIIIRIRIIITTIAVIGTVVVLIGMIVCDNVPAKTWLKRIFQKTLLWHCPVVIPFHSIVGLFHYHYIWKKWVVTMAQQIQINYRMKRGTCLVKPTQIHGNNSCCYKNQPTWPITTIIPTAAAAATTSAAAVIMVVVTNCHRVKHVNTNIRHLVLELVIKDPVYSGINTDQDFQKSYTDENIGCCIHHNIHHPSFFLPIRVHNNGWKWCIPIRHC